MDIREIEKYLSEDIKRSIQNDVFPLVGSSSVSLEAGLFAALREIFAYVDYFGYLYKGESSTKSAVSFLRDYLGRVDKRYDAVGGLLYYIYRHGTIHEYEPKNVRLREGTRVAWFVFKDRIKELHLSGYWKEGILWLRIHLNSLYDDLNSAIDLYIQDLKSNAALRENFKKARREIEQPEGEEEVRRKARNYICESDFDFIKKLSTQAKAPSSLPTGSVHSGLIYPDKVEPW